MQQDNQLKYQGANRHPRTLSANQSVRVRNFRGGKWIPGTIVRKFRPRTFEVLVRRETRRCHMDQLVAPPRRYAIMKAKKIHGRWSWKQEQMLVWPSLWYSVSRLNPNHENIYPAGNKDSVSCQQEMGAKAPGSGEEPPVKSYL